MLGDEDVKEPTFKDVVIFYNYVFDLGRNVNPTEAARKLLKTDLALSSPNYLTDDIEIAERFKKLLKIRDHALWLADLSSHLENGGLKGVARGILSNPKQSFYLLRNILGARNRENESERDTNYKRDVQTITKDTVKFIDESMIKSQSFEGLQRFSDRMFFSPLYLREVPFARVGLQPFFATTKGEELDIDVGVLIHRAGVAILTFYVMFKGYKTINALIDVKTSSSTKITQLEVARCIIEPQARPLGLTNSKFEKAPCQTRFSSGIEWVKYEHLKDVNFVDVFESYREAITSAVQAKRPPKISEPVRLRTPDWLAYPIIFVRDISPACLTGEAFKRKYAKALVGILGEFRNWEEIRTEKIMENMSKDFSLTYDHSFYLGASHATVFYYGSHKSNLVEQFGDDIPGQEWLLEHFQISGLINVLLIQRWILHILDSELRVLSLNLNKLNVIKRNLLLSLEEYNDILVSYGSAQDIINAGHEILGSNVKYNGIMIKLGIIEKLIEVEESHRRSRRDLFLRLVTTFATLIFGLSGTKQVIDVVSSWESFPTNKDVGWFIRLFNSFIIFVHEHPTRATQLLYGTVVVLVLLAMLWSVLPTRGRKVIVSYDQSRPANTSNFTWPVTLQYKVREKEEIRGSAHRDSSN